MNTERQHITVQGIEVEVVRKAIKNLHLGVYPPNGRVRVAAPHRVSDDAVRLAIVGKLGWIKRHQARFEAQPRQSRREMVSGESHYFLGRRYRLRVINHDGAARIVLRNKASLELHVRPGTRTGDRERILYQWYRRQLKQMVPPILDKWQKAMSVEATRWGIKRMKTRWGSCNTTGGRIWINLELAKKSAECIEYIIVHELAHFIERRHNERFIQVMDQHLPHWRIHRHELNSTPLAHDIWGY